MIDGLDPAKTPYLRLLKPDWHAIMRQPDPDDYVDQPVQRMRPDLWWRRQVNGEDAFLVVRHG